MKRYEAWVTLIAASIDKPDAVEYADYLLDILESQPAFEGWDGERKDD